MIITFLNKGFCRNLLIALALFASLGACQMDKSEAPASTTMFVTTNSGSLYCFDLATDSLCWQQLQTDPDIDELSYMTVYKGQLIKDYLNGTIVSYAKNSGRQNWIFRDSVSKDQAFYGYHFDDVRFVHFYQRPVVYGDHMLFANSHGEIKSVSIEDRTEKWNYQSGTVLMSEPLVEGDAVYQTTGYQLVKLAAETGKQLAKFNLEEGSSFAPKLHDGLLYILTEKGRVYCLNQELAMQWEYKPTSDEGYVHSELFITDNTILLPFDGLSALDPKTGDIQWTMKDLGDIKSLDLLERNKYAVLAKDRILILDRSGKVAQEKAWSPDLGQPLALTVANSNLYMITYQGALYKMSSQLDQIKLLKSDLQLNNERGLQAAYFLKE
ncbi:outer membrane protein assembly factor BamB family protein [Sphingobacterium tabacisoli]|uniref:PQQ-binding-like beta-propeller repeat protein n=1 Tax=Sphingobacterium tabacisoli TaxID=2044855 RepID=A0ABW5L5H3_9SPHI|nr:PQQ-binding-like beta-propeller repeat protein [Sphingobacterium tabacisoli]